MGRETVEGHIHIHIVAIVADPEVGLEMVGFGVALVTGILGVDLVVLRVDLVVLGMDLAGVLLILPVLGVHCCIAPPLHYAFLRKTFAARAEATLGRWAAPAWQRA